MKTRYIFAINFTLAIIVPAIALAHVEADETSGSTLTTAVIVEPDLFTVGVATPVFIKIKDRANQKDITGLDVMIAVENSKDKIVFTSAAKKSGENYVFEYTFPTSGAYSIRAEFIYKNKSEKFGFPIFVSASTNASVNNSLAATAIIGAIAVSGILLFWIKKKRVKLALLWTLIIALALILAYSLYVTLMGGQTGVITCLESGECFWTAHIHAYVPIFICGDEYRLPVEVGRLDGPHTHEEKNIAHWHDRLPYDKKTQTLKDTAPLTLKAFFDALELDFNNQKIINKKNNDLCSDGKAGSVHMFVNGIHNTEFERYVWKDQDVIVIFFDTRPAGALEEQIKANPILFPKLGRG